jgi:hypothetical protein
MRATDMIDIHDTARDDTRLESLAAELTSAVYPLVLRCGPKDSWLQVELGLWRGLAKTVKQWARQRPPAASAEEFEAWRAGLLRALTACAFAIALNHGIEGSLRDLELSLYGAVHLVMEVQPFQHRRGTYS